MATSGQFQKQSASTPARTYLTTNLAQRRPAPRPKPTPQPVPEPDVQAKDDRTNSAPRFPNLIWNPTRYGVQPKLTVGAPNDQYEQEADRVADQVMSMPDKPVQRMDNLEEEELQTKPLAGSITPLVQRMDNLEEEDIQTKTSGNADIQREETLEEKEIQTKPLGNIQREDNLEEEELQTKAIANTLQCEEIPEEEEVQTKPLGSIQREEMPEEEDLQMKPIASIQREEMPEEEEPLQMKRSPNGSLEAGGSIETQLNSSKGGGSPLPDEVRSFMEPRFGADFSQVRVHTGSEAVQMNRDLNAQAFTHRQDVYFGAGKAPGKDALTAHELTHVVQQIGGIPERTFEQSFVQPQCSTCEKEDMKVQRSVEISGDQESKVRRGGEEECCTQEREKEQAASKVLSDAEDDVEKKTEVAKNTAALAGVACVGTILTAAKAPTPLSAIAAAIACVGGGLYTVKSPLLDLKMARKKLKREEAAYGRAAAKLNYCAANCDSSQKVSPPTPELYQ